MVERSQSPSVPLLAVTLAILTRGTHSWLLGLSCGSRCQTSADFIAGSSFMYNTNYGSTCKRRTAVPCAERVQDDILAGRVQLSLAVSSSDVPSGSTPTTMSAGGANGPPSSHTTHGPTSAQQGSTSKRQGKKDSLEDRYRDHGASMLSLHDTQLSLSLPLPLPGQITNLS